MITVSWLQPPRCRIRRATARPVVLASMTIESPSWTSAAAAAPMRDFSSCWSRSRRSNAGSGRSRSATMAPPWVRMQAPLLLERREVLADRDGGHGEPRGEVPDADAALLGDEAGDVVLALTREDIAGRGAGRDGQTRSPLGPGKRGHRGFGSVSTHLVPKRSAMSRNQIEIKRNLWQASRWHPFPTGSNTSAGPCGDDVSSSDVVAGPVENRASTAPTIVAAARWIAGDGRRRRT